MQRKWMLLIALVATVATSACGASRQSGICGDVNPAATGTGDIAALETQAEDAWTARADQAQTETAIAAWEQILTIDPARYDIRTKLSRAHYFLADSHLWFKKTIDDDEPTAALMLQNYKKGTDQAEFALGQQYPGFRTKYCARQPFDTALQQLDKEAVGAMYWYAVNLGRWALQTSLVQILNNKDRIKAMMETVSRLDAPYWYYAADRYFGAYFTKIPFPSGDLPKSKTYFEKSIAGGPQYLATSVVFARMNLAKAGDRERFQAILEGVRDYDLNGAPEVRPENAAEQRKAEYYLQEMEFIVEE